MSLAKQETNPEFAQSPMALSRSTAQKNKKQNPLTLPPSDRKMELVIAEGRFFYAKSC